MTKSLYRNLYYVKESIAEFFYANKKRVITTILALILGISLGLYVGLSNTSNFTVINIFNQTTIAIFCGQSFFAFIFKSILKHCLYVLIILVSNNFNFLCLANYILFAYLAFSIILDSIILICLLGIKGILYVFLCFLPFNLLLIFILLTIFLISKNQSETCGNCSKFQHYPYKTIAFLLVISLIILALIFLISKIFCNFIVIIV